VPVPSSADMGTGEVQSTGSVPESGGRASQWYDAVE
jgi:hypothetical protein